TKDIGIYVTRRRGRRRACEPPPEPEQSGKCRLDEACAAAPVERGLWENQKGAEPGGLAFKGEGWNPPSGREALVGGGDVRGCARGTACGLKVRRVPGTRF